MFRIWNSSNSSCVAFLDILYARCKFVLGINRFILAFSNFCPDTENTSKTVTASSAAAAVYAVSAVFTVSAVKAVDAVPAVYKSS